MEPKESQNFLNRFENYLFQKYTTADHIPVTAYVVKVILILGFSIIAMSFVTGMFGISYEKSSILFRVTLLTALVLIVYKVYRSSKTILTSKGKALYFMYTLGSFFIGAGIFLKIVLYVIVALIVLFFIFALVGRFFGIGLGEDEPETKHYASTGNGKKEELKQTGSGPVGEKYFKGKDSGQDYTSY